MAKTKRYVDPCNCRQVNTEETVRLLAEQKAGLDTATAAALAREKAAKAAAATWESAVEQLRLQCGRNSQGVESQQRVEELTTPTLRSACPARQTVPLSQSEGLTTRLAELLVLHKTNSQQAALPASIFTKPPNAPQSPNVLPPNVPPPQPQSVTQPLKTRVLPFGSPLALGARASPLASSLQSCSNVDYVSSATVSVEQDLNSKRREISSPREAALCSTLSKLDAQLHSLHLDIDSATQQLGLTYMPVIDASRGL